MKNAHFLLHTGWLFAMTLPVPAQTTLYVPNGVNGISSSSSNYVGVGVTSPGATLEVAGTGRFTGQVTPTTNGAGVEISQAGGIGIIESYSRGTGGIPLRLYGYPTSFWGGNVGIGTPNPAAKLTLKATDGATGGIRLQHSNDNGPMVNIHQASGDGAIDLYTGENPTVLRTHISAYGHTFFSPAGGNVGIGTTSPAEKLHVMGNVQLGIGHPNNYYIRHRTSTNWDYYFAANGDDYRIYDAQGTDFLRFRYSGGGANKHAIIAETISAYHNGNVGIGTTSPAHKLAVNGTVKAKEVIVETTGWSDYVFADDYRLAPLAEVEAHITAKKHLPGIPSAAEVERGGVSLGDMQAKMMAKIEELTLHVIRQEKEIQSLKHRLTDAGITTETP